MNLKNLMMWGVIVLLVVGLFNYFKNPTQSNGLRRNSFFNFFGKVDDGRVVQ